MEAVWWLLGIAAVCAVAAMVGFRRRERDAADGVLYRFMDLRVTKDRLLVARPTPTVYPLAGLVARVEDAADMRSVYLTINGPRTTLLRQASTSKDRRAGFKARAFAEVLNLQVRQQG